VRCLLKAAARAGQLDVRVLDAGSAAHYVSATVFRVERMPKRRHIDGGEAARLADDQKAGDQGRKGKK
jgi:hypothetical protein